jgi:hypothetical protein
MYCIMQPYKLLYLNRSINYCIDIPTLYENTSSHKFSLLTT